MSNFRGLLDALRDPKNSQGLLDMGVSLMGASGPSPVPMSFGQRFAQGYMGSQQMAAERAAAELKRRYTEAQIKSLEQPGGSQSIAGPLQEFEAAKAGGFTGTYLDFVKAKAEAAKVNEREQVGDPATVREWQYFNSLPPADQQRFIEMKRAFPITNVGNVPTQVLPGGATNPLSTPDRELGAARDKAAASAAGAAAGGAQADAANRLPQAETDAQYALTLVRDLQNHPGKKYALGAYSMAPTVPGTPQADFRARLEQLQGKQFLTAYESLKGSGQISEIEGKKAEAAIARMQASQSVGAFDAAAKEFASIIERNLQNVRRKAAGSAAAPASPTTVRKYNPQTGRIE